MNCNRCGTPILPGEDTCRFCGAVGNYSERKNIVAPEIIDFVEPEIIDFTTGEDDVVVSGEAKPATPTAPTVPNVPAQPVAPAPVSTSPAVPVSQPTVAPVTPAKPEVATPVTPSVPAEPVVQEVTAQPAVAPAPVTPITAAPVTNSVEKKEEEKEPAAVETPVVPEVTTPAPEAPTAVSESTPVVVTSPTEQKTEEKTEEKPEKEKKVKKSGGLSVGTFILVILLIASIVLNCFLLMGDSEDNTKVEEQAPVVSETKQTLYFNKYKLETPSNWIAVSNQSVPYITIMDRSEEWAVTIDVSTETDSALIEDSAEQIKEAFKNNKYLFTDSYPKSANNREFYVFKGKYQNYTVYVITTKLESNNTVVADLKFKSEVDEDVLEKVLETLSTVSTKDLTEFYNNNFDFGTITNLVKDNIVVEDIDTTTEGN